MSNPKTEQLAAAQKANAEAMLALMRSALDNLEKLANLNLATLREGVAVSAQNANTLIDAKDANQAMAVQNAAIEPGLERTRAYYHNLYELVLNMQKDITSVMESHYKALSEHAENAVEETASKIPVSGDVFATAMKSMLQSSSQAFDRMNFMAQQMAQIADSNFRTLASVGAVPPAATVAATTQKATRAAAKAAK
ncbi:MAG: phasin family protein [Zoogloeaceae bacterium]|jgi:phasin family protein|nr:phasin family protein [Zoogloeaceae bacterium]